MEHKFEPFERVMVRNADKYKWQLNLYSHYELCDETGKPSHVCVGGYFYQCIPYANNEHLLGTTDSPEPKYEYKFGDWIEYLSMNNNEWCRGIYVGPSKLDGRHCILMERTRLLGESRHIRPLKED